MNFEPVCICVLIYIPHNSHYICVFIVYIHFVFVDMCQHPRWGGGGAGEIQ